MTLEDQAGLGGMPPLAPSYATSWHCSAMEGLDIIYEVDEEAVRSTLAGTPFEYVGSRAWTHVGRLVDHDLVPHDSAWHHYGLYIAARYGGIIVRFPVFMYADNVEAIPAGRELLGEPKKWGDIGWTHEAATLRYELGRRGRPLVSIGAELGAEMAASSPIADLLAGTGFEAGSNIIDITLRSMPSPVADDPPSEHVIINPSVGTAVSTTATLRRFDVHGAPSDYGWLVADPLYLFELRRIVSASWQTGSYDNGVKRGAPARIESRQATDSTRRDEQG